MPSSARQIDPEASGALLDEGRLPLITTDDLEEEGAVRLAKLGVTGQDLVPHG